MLALRLGLTLAASAAAAASAFVAKLDFADSRNSQYVPFL